jgi:hypothetical protein
MLRILQEKTSAQLLRFYTLYLKPPSIRPGFQNEKGSAIDANPLKCQSTKPDERATSQTTRSQPMIFGMPDVLAWESVCPISNRACTKSIIFSYPIVDYQ